MGFNPAIFDQFEYCRKGIKVVNADLYIVTFKGCI